MHHYFVCQHARSKTVPPAGFFGIFLSNTSFLNWDITNIFMHFALFYKHARHVFSCIYYYSQHSSGKISVRYRSIGLKHQKSQELITNIKLSYKEKFIQHTERLHRFGKRCVKGQCKEFADYARSRKCKGRDA